MTEETKDQTAAHLTARSLGLFRADGLYANLESDAAEVLRWEQEAPLRLVAGALVDLGGKARLVRTTDLKERLRKVIDPKRFENWWELVQPALRDSEQFDYDARKGTRLRAKPADIRSRSLDELRTAARRNRSEASRVRPAAKLADWVTWVQADEVSAMPAGIPPDELRLVLQNLPTAAIPVAMDRIVVGVEHQLLGRRKPANRAMEAWINALVGVLNRWLEVSSGRSSLRENVVAMVAQLYEIPDSQVNNELGAWLAGFVSKDYHNLRAVVEAIVSASEESPDGVYRLLSVVRDRIDSNTRIILWKQLLQLKLEGGSRAIAGKWLRLIEPVARAEVLLLLVIAAKDEESIREAGRLLRTEWAQSDPPERHHLFQAALIAWLAHGRLGFDAREVLDAVVLLGEGHWTSGNHYVTRVKELAESLHKRETERLHTAATEEIEALRGALGKAKSAYGLRHRQSEYLQRELESTSQRSALDITRDAILVLGDTMQQLTISEDPFSKRLQSASAGIVLALSALGAETFGEVGETLPFDPTMHDVRQPPATGTPVRIIAPGLRYSHGSEADLVLLRVQAEVDR